MKKELVAIATLSCPLFVSLVPGQGTRVEKDLLGEKQIPADAYYGVQAALSLENFPISGVLINHYSGFIEAWTIAANEAYKSGKGILEIIREKKILTEAQIKELLDPVKLTGLDKSKYQRK